MLLITAQPIRNLRTPASADMNKRGFLEQASPPPLPNPLPFFPSSLSPTPYPFRRLLRRLLRPLSVICPGKLPTCPALSPVTRKQEKWRRRDHHSLVTLLAFSRLVLPTEPLDNNNNNNNLYIYSALFNILDDQKRITTIKSLWRRQPHVPKRVIPVCSAVVLFKPVKGNSSPFFNFNINSKNRNAG